MGTETVVALLMGFYDLHARLWKDSRERHEHEVRSLLDAVLASFEADLSPEEREVYDVLPKPYWKDAFRICRSLARYEGPGAPVPPVFFLSHDELALRIGQSSQTGGNILKVFVRSGLLTIARPGVKRGPGTRGETTHYRWAPALVARTRLPC